MPSNVKIVKNINWKGLQLHNEVNAFAGMIVKDIRDGISSGKDINGSSFARLKASTVKQKKRKGYSRPSSPLIATGQIKEIYVKPRATRGKEIASVQVPKGRDGINRIVIGQIHNIGDGVPKRKWFGIGTRGKKKLDRAAKKLLHEKLRIKK